VKVYLWKVHPHTLLVEERGTQGTVDNYPHFKTHPQLFHHLALAAPATDGKLEGVSEYVAEDISNAYLYSDARQSEPNVCTLERN